MSDPVRIALVAEGPTDRIVIEAAMRSMLGERAFVLKQLQPEGSLAFGPSGTGWVGVYRWCKQAARRGGGRLANDRLIFLGYDLLLLHLDADVAENTYQRGNIQTDPGDGPLPCDKKCPPPSATTNALREVLLTWCGERAVSARTVICMPSKSTEAWVLAALFPADAAVGGGLECLAAPESRLGQQPKKRRVAKSQAEYARHAGSLRKEWPRLMKLEEAARFRTEFLRVVSTLDKVPAPAA